MLMSDIVQSLTRIIHDSIRQPERIRAKKIDFVIDDWKKSEVQKPQENFYNCPSSKYFKAWKGVYYLPIFLNDLNNVLL